MLLGFIAPITEAGGTANYDYDPYLENYFDAGWLATNNLFENETGEIFQNITSQFIANDHEWPNDVQDITFTEPVSGRIFHTTIVMDYKDYNPNSEKTPAKYQNYFYFVRHYQWLSYKEAFIGFEEIESKWNDREGYSKIHLNLYSEFDVYIKPDANWTLHDALYSGGHYSIYAAQAVMDAAQSGNDAFSIISSILTFDFVGTGTILDVFISTPMWIAIIYLAYRTITSIIPFLGGG